jgi:hypothetical protein
MAEPKWVSCETYGILVERVCCTKDMLVLVGNMLLQEHVMHTSRLRSSLSAAESMLPWREYCRECLVIVWRVIVGK